MRCSLFSVPVIPMRTDGWGRFDLAWRRVDRAALWHDVSRIHFDWWNSALLFL